VSVSDTAPSYLPAESVHKLLLQLTHDYSNEARRFDYRNLPLVDARDEPAETQGARERSAARHAYLEYRGERRAVSIIVPTFGGAHLLALCIESLSRQSYAKRHPQQVELVVVEDGVPAHESTVFEDERVLAAFDTLRKLGVAITRLRLRENKGRAIARNVALAHATRAIVVLIDNSMVLEGDFLTEHLIRHETLNRPIALLGFKENISFKDFELDQAAIRTGKRRPRLEKDWKTSHVLRLDEAPLTFGGKTYEAGDTIRYMDLTGFLQGFQGTSPIGRRTLPTFFQTNVVSARREDILRAGGFEPTLVLWGLEDSLLGARLIASADCRLIPCPSARAFNISEEVDPENKAEDLTYNRSLYDQLLSGPAAEDHQSLFVKSAREFESLVEVLEEGARPSPVSPYDLDDATRVAREVASNRETPISVTRRQLIALIAAARAGASSSVTNLSGDLSWVAEELDALRAVTAIQPSLRIRFFYDRTRVPDAMHPTLRALHELGVELRPYPERATPSFRCMLIDPDDSGERRVVWMAKDNTTAATAERMDHRFWWNETRARPGDSFVVDSIRALVTALEASPRKPLRIGILGVNNVGKTTLASKLKTYLEARHLPVAVVEDVFRSGDAKVDAATNYSMLAMQLAAEKEEKDCAVVLYDRTSIDNFCFLQLRHGESQSQRGLIANIVGTARTFDLVLDVRWPGDDYSTNTLRVTAAQRGDVRARIDRFMKSHSLKADLVTIQPSQFESSIAAEVARIGAQIEQLALTARLAKGP
jgi:GT2 family glycosyltransferase